jgi:hypothetical protein
MMISTLDFGHLCFRIFARCIHNRKYFKKPVITFSTCDGGARRLCEQYTHVLGALLFIVGDLLQAVHIFLEIESTMSKG